MLSVLTDNNKANVFTAFYERYALALLNTAIKKLALEHESQADDLVHDVFVGFYEKLPTLPEDTNVYGYLYTSLRNRMLNFFRREAYKQQFLSVEPTKPVEQQPTHPLQQERLEREIHNHIAQLPEQCRKVFVLSRLENYTNKQIAEALGISINTVEQHMRRALRLLREKMNYNLFMILMLSADLTMVLGSS